MTAYESRFITPPTEQEEVYPYRRVWPSLIIENGVLFAVVIILFLVTRFITIPDRLHLPIGVGLCVVPVALWLVVSYYRERLVTQPREKLLLVAIIGALTANAVGLPLVHDVLQVEQWLSLQSAVNRIVGYTFTLGLVQAILTYLILRYLVWPDHFRSRFDSIAYGAAHATGYAVVTNLNFILSANPAPDIAAMTIFDNSVVLQITGMLVGYGLAEVRFTIQPMILFLTGSVAFASLVSGIAVPIRSGLSNASLSSLINVSSTRPILGFLFSAALFAGISFILAFLLNTAQRRDLEAAAEDENL